MKMGLLGDLESKKFLEYEDILRMFELSDRGEDAIDIFCDHIMGVLKSRIQETRGPMTSVGVLCMGLEDIKQVWHSLVLRIRHLPRSSMFLGALLALQAALWELNFSYYQEQGNPYAFCATKDFGLNLRILTILLFLSMARSTMGMLYGIKFIKLLVPMGFNIQVHSFIGFCVLFHAFGHMVGHIIYHNANVEGGSATHSCRSLS
jgi:hypothetical protein